MNTKLETQLFEECISKGFNCSLTYQRMNDYSIEIYTGYIDSYNPIYYTDGYTEKTKALKDALRFLRTGK